MPSTLARQGPVEDASLAVPAPQRALGAQVHAAEPAVEADQRDAVGAAGEHGGAGGGELRARPLPSHQAVELASRSNAIVSPMNGASSRAMLARNASLAGARAACHGLEQLPLGAAEAVARAGQLLEQPPQRGREEGQALVGRGGGAGERARVVGAERRPTRRGRGARARA